MSPAPCRQCGKEISPEDVSCPQCGATQLLSALPSEPPPAAPPASSFRKPSPSPRPPAPGAPQLDGLELEAPSSRLTPMHGLLAVGGVLVIAIFWYGFIGRPSSEKPVAPPAPAPLAAPAPAEEAPAAAPALPQMSAAERQAATEMLEVLQALQAMTTGNATPQEYTSRVANAKVQVEKYLKEGEGDRAVKQRVHEAMLVHILAATAWKAKVLNRPSEYEEVGTHQGLSACPDLKPLLDLPLSTGGERTPAMTRGVNAAENLDRIWFCAAGKVDALEQAIKARSG